MQILEKILIFFMQISEKILIFVVLKINILFKHILRQNHILSPFIAAINQCNNHLTHKATN